MSARTTMARIGEVVPRRRIGLVAHDHKKLDLLEWAGHNRSLLANHDLVATGTTGRLLAEQLNLNVARLHSGPLGGDQQLGAMITNRMLDVLVFFWDPLSPQPHDPDVRALLRIAVVWNLPIACNRATADFLITSPLLATDYERDVPNYGERYDESYDDDRDWDDFARKVAIA